MSTSSRRRTVPPERREDCDAIQYANRRVAIEGPPSLRTHSKDYYSRTSNFKKMPFHNNPGDIDSNVQETLESGVDVRSVQSSRPYMASDSQNSSAITNHTSMRPPLSRWSSSKDALYPQPSLGTESQTGFHRRVDRRVPMGPAAMTNQIQDSSSDYRYSAMTSGSRFELPARPTVPSHTRTNGGQKPKDPRIQEASLPQRPRDPRLPLPSSTSHVSNLPKTSPAVNVDSLNQSDTVTAASTVRQACQSLSSNIQSSQLEGALSSTIRPISDMYSPAVLLAQKRKSALQLGDTCISGSGSNLNNGSQAPPVQPSGAVVQQASETVASNFTEPIGCDVLHAVEDSSSKEQLVSATAYVRSGSDMEDVKPHIEELEKATIRISPVCDEDRGEGCVAFTRTELPSDYWSKDSAIRKMARSQLRTEQEKELSKIGRKLVKGHWRDDGVAFDWILVRHGTPADKIVDARYEDVPIVTTGSHDIIKQNASANFNSHGVSTTSTSKPSPSFSSVVLRPAISASTSQINTSSPDNTNQFIDGKRTEVQQDHGSLTSAEFQTQHKVIAQASTADVNSTAGTSQESSQKVSAQSAIPLKGGRQEARWGPPIYSMPPFSGTINRIYKYELLLPPGMKIGNKFTPDFQTWKLQHRDVATCPDSRGYPTREVLINHEAAPLCKVLQVKVVPVDMKNPESWPLSMFPECENIPISDHLRYGKKYEKWVTIQCDKVSEPDWDGRPTRWIRLIPNPARKTPLKIRWRQKTDEEIESYTGPSVGMSNDLFETDRTKPSKPTSLTAAGANSSAFQNSVASETMMNVQNLDENGYYASETTAQILERHEKEQSRTKRAYSFSSDQTERPEKLQKKDSSPEQDNLIRDVPQSLIHLPTCDISSPANTYFEAANRPSLTSTPETAAPFTAQLALAEEPFSAPPSLPSSIAPILAVDTNTVNNTLLDVLSNHVRQKMTEISKWTHLLQDFSDMSDAVKEQIQRIQDEIFDLHDQIKEARRGL
ncbi:uncharacterized protein L203_100309 [Cryptococcus depauperatus CBS 7841]|uniref:Uncharacterized protein n=1 Tax=Cryptococcus depauperatus CBS 7841 TaxID=1295531 RepID=A0A1E3IZ16_9TREE|nr:hypothetical protein L203_00032 [Cryptococcus depauperatus CBS 7841]